MLINLPEKLYTVDEFWAFMQLPENEGRRLELDEGVIVDMGSSSKRNTITAARIIYLLSAHVLPNNLGVITAPDSGFKLGKRTWRQPDVAYVSAARLDTLDGTYFTQAPDLAVEVASEGEDTFKKAQEYLSAGTRMVWIFYVLERSINVVTLKADGEYRVVQLTDEDTLDGGEVLPGFSLPVREIFPAE
jgi:Uma2 family endonuclease